ncbi:TPA: QacE family quaternary ammonium compound efflux SMR transporter [Citrobacter farmeri]|nr:QacE family quaternary ammonium compound efflux SMR transporter [Citrobacter farmeri]HCA0999138.1 QacE family quaternary ammonium compound efflux SMR transporter [Citrobacter farmeri]HCA1859733.1 QacE family quaternary ammonium compound efflux SMR transporter [Citrobacter farmeri]
MKGWLFLVIAIVGEVIATSALKSSEGFTKLAPSAVVIIGYGIAFYFLSLVLKSIPVGVAYAVWSGLGVVIIRGLTLNRTVSHVKSFLSDKSKYNGH